MITTVFAYAALAGLAYWIAQLVRVAWKRPGAKRQALYGFGVAAVSFVIVGVTAPRPSEAEKRAKAEQTEAKACSDEPMFFVIAQKFVRQSLKAPSTAAFPSAPSQAVKVSDCRYVLTSYVDAQNSFGAQIRSTWGVDIEYHPETDTYSAHHIEVQ